MPLTSPPHPLELYRWAVQDPETHAVLLRIMFDRLGTEGPARILREDFAGTAADSVAWVALKADRQATAIDRDPDTVQWARDRANRLLGERATLVRLLCRDVFDVEIRTESPPADIVSVLNFSIMYMHDVAALDRYLRIARAGLRPGGIFVCNLFGGPGISKAHTHRTRIMPRARLSAEPAPPAFDYTWEVRSIDRERSIADCRMHFRLDCAADECSSCTYQDAFTYAFRLWSPRELCSALMAAGFTSAHIWQHTVQSGQPVLCPLEPAQLERQSAWTIYLIGVT